MVRAVGGLLALAVLGAAVAFAFPTAVPATTLPAAAPRHERPTPEQVSDAEIEAGRRLYLQSCASCHGVRGEGTEYAPGLQAAGPATNDFYLRTGRMPLGRLGTPPWEQEPQLSDQQIRELVAYTSQLGDGPEIPSVVADISALQRGWQLYINHCAACHGTSAGGGGIGGGVVAPGLARADPLIVAEAMLVGPGAMPRFSFPQADVNAIAGYVQHLVTAPSPGGIPLAGAGPVPEGFIAALFGLGLLIAVARWTGRRPEEPKDARPRE